MKKTIVSKDWIGGSPRVTISHVGNIAVIKLLKCRTVRGTTRQNNSNLSDTPSVFTIKIPVNDIGAILDAAINLSRRAGNCWIWDSNNIGVADLYNSKPVSETNVSVSEFLDDEIGF